MFNKKQQSQLGATLEKQNSEFIIKKIEAVDLRVQLQLKMVFLASKSSPKTNSSPSYLEFKQIQVLRKYLKSHLEKRFSRLYAERILDFFEFNQVITINELIEKFNILILSGREDILKFCFQILDINEDGLLCMKDLTDNFQIIGDQDYFIQQDLNTLVKLIFKQSKNQNHQKMFAFKATTQATSSKHKYFRISDLIAKTQQKNLQENALYNSQITLSSNRQQSLHAQSPQTNKTLMPKLNLKKRHISTFHDMNLCAIQQFQQSNRQQNIQQNTYELKISSKRRIGKNETSNLSLNQELPKTMKIDSQNAKNKGFIHFVSEIVKKREENETPIVMFGSKSKQIENKHENHQKDFNIKSIFNDYMRESYFKENENITVKQFVNEAQFDHILPYLFIDLIQYIFKHKIIDDQGKKIQEEDDFQDCNLFEALENQYQKIQEAHKKPKINLFKF
eukprot:403375843